VTTRAQSILVADDEQGLRDLFHFTLEPIGYEVVTVENGLGALEAIGTRSFDLVILDVHMPGMGGPEAYRRMRDIRPQQKVLVVSSSSDVNHTFEESLTAEKDVECLYKPFTLDEMLAAIEHAIGRKNGDRP